MYCNFFGFSEKPFDVTPDPKFLYLSPGHQEMLASLIYGIRERRGFISIVGEVGTGKTTLLNAVLDRLDERTKVAYMFNTAVGFQEMLNMALVELGLANANETPSKVEALHRLNNFAIEQLAKGHNVVFIVDEAQNLDDLSMENLRLLSNLETRKHKLVQIVLSGQPELDTKLRKPELRQLAQRISLKRYIIPLNEKETYEYIQHRLAIAGDRGRSVFSSKAKQLIWEYSGGVPRKINMVCDNAFLIGYGLREKRIKVGIVEEAIKDLSWSPFSKTAEPSVELPSSSKGNEPSAGLTSRPLFALTSWLVIAVLLLVGAGVLFGNSMPNTEWERFLQRYNPFSVKSKWHPDANQSLVSVLSEADYQPKIVEENAFTDIVDEQVESADLEERISKEESSVNPEVAPDERDDALRKQPDTTDDRPVPSVPAEPQNQAGTVRESVLTDMVEEGVEAGESKTEIKKENSVVNPGTVVGEGADVLTGQRKFVVVKRNDFLLKIIRENYGYFREPLLIALLHENPDIKDPDYIVPGQVIKLPATNESE